MSLTVPSHARNTSDSSTISELLIDPKDDRYCQLTDMINSLTSNLSARSGEVRTGLASLQGSSGSAASSSAASSLAGSIKAYLEAATKAHDDLALRNEPVLPNQLASTDDGRTYLSSVVDRCGLSENCNPCVTALDGDTSDRRASVKLREYSNALRTSGEALASATQTGLAGASADAKRVLAKALEAELSGNVDEKVKGLEEAAESSVYWPTGVVRKAMGIE
ncbi:hypothetical protein IAT38_005793 [Cryptococcus sp. DSM 104549]